MICSARHSSQRSHLALADNLADFCHFVFVSMLYQCCINVVSIRRKCNDIIRTFSVLTAGDRNFLNSLETRNLLSKILLSGVERKICFPVVVVVVVVLPSHRCNQMCPTVGNKDVKGIRERLPRGFLI